MKVDNLKDAYVARAFAEKLKKKIAIMCDNTIQELAKDYRGLTYDKNERNKSQGGVTLNLLGKRNM